MTSQEYILELLNDIQKIALLLESKGIDTNSIYAMKAKIEKNKPNIKYELKPMRFYFVPYRREKI